MVTAADCSPLFPTRDEQKLVFVRLGVEPGTFAPKLFTLAGIAVGGMGKDAQEDVGG